MMLYYIRKYVLLLLAFMLVASSAQSSSNGKDVREEETGRARSLENNVFIHQEDLPRKGSEEEFTGRCTGFLLSKGVLEDQKVSNAEFANFFTTICIEAEMCQQGDGIPYDELNSRLKTAFTKNACYSEGAPSCYFDFKSTQSDFGFVANGPDTLFNLDARISSLCESSYTIISEDGMFDTPRSVIEGDETTPGPLSLPPTAQPVLAPTSDPVVGPEKLIIPTLRPTTSPTEMTTSTARSSTQFDTTENGGTALSTAAILGIIAAAASVVFCLAVMYSGGFKEPEYDMNQPDFDGSFIKHQHNDRTDQSDHCSSDDFRDEDIGKPSKKSRTKTRCLETSELHQQSSVLVPPCLPFTTPTLR